MKNNPVTYFGSLITGCIHFSWLRYMLMTHLHICMYIHRYFDYYFAEENIWATAWQNQTNECAPSEDQISLSIHPVWSESSLSAWRKFGFLATHKAHSEDWSDWAHAQADLSLRWAHSHFVFLPCRGSYYMTWFWWNFTLFIKLQSSLSKKEG